MVHVTTILKPGLIQRLPDHNAVDWMEKRPLTAIPVNVWRNKALRRGLLSEEDIDTYLNEIINGINNL